MSYHIAFQGEHYAFSEMAAKKYFGDDTVCQALPTFEEVFQAVATARIPLGIVPIENTLYGSIHRNFDLLLEHNVTIIGEVNLRIELHLIAFPEITLEQITKAYSHPAALEQCRNFFTRHKHIEPVSTYDTAGSVKLIYEQQEKSIAAIAGKWVAHDYGMNILCENIEDFTDNYTRFFIISSKKLLLGKANKTSIVFSTKDIPGALFKSLSVFFLRDINLTKIESRPLKGKAWEYLFYLDFEGHPQEERCLLALRHLEEIASFIKILGSYPAANFHRTEQSENQIIR